MVDPETLEIDNGNFIRTIRLYKEKWTSSMAIAFEIQIHGGYYRPIFQEFCI